MFGKLIGAALGRRMAGRHSGVKGAMIGAAAPWIARRAFGPLGFALAGGWAAKKYYDNRKSRKERSRSDYTAPRSRSDFDTGRSRDDYGTRSDL